MTLFITGTDTDSGKTLISAALLTLAKGKTAGFKPIASGCDNTEAGLRNADAQALMAAANTELEYATVNPLSFEPAIAPHIAAAEQNVSLCCELLNQVMDFDALKDLDFALVEGAGGWLLPFNQSETMADWVEQQGWPVLLVVGVKLGCLNHAMLTVADLKARGVTLAGWVANQVEPDMDYFQDNVDYLTQAIDAPCFGVVPYLQRVSVEAAAEYLHFPDSFQTS
ncbi:dethiobiotin synthase [Paraferrimonas sedimenticola]|uniref:ATP-dependent dethiobiotin synthetase BioD n=1 Tax=Paraferrimonas sedimenticola TaxID=375674 RepID=A0AA37RXC6_9GAMM|nr:dethiobiotin synthase [Paraferrimonas sedimenticola]GLP96659.1 ATP-dependent dethiobiotin synthetase BioD [Paraferrimonas sedimenticola]